MKDLWKSGILIVLIIGGLYIIFLRECKRDVIQKDEITIKKSVWDSIQTLANKPAEFKTDTVIIKGKTIYIPSKPIPVPIIDPKDNTVKTYSDSVILPEISFYAKMGVVGTLKTLSLSYTPIKTIITNETKVYIPKIINNPVDKPVNGLFLYGAFGGNQNSVLFGGGLDFITKKGTEIGYLYQRFGNVNFHSAKIGIKLKW